MKLKAIKAVCAGILLALAMSGCGGPGEAPYQPPDDEIALQIQLDLDEDIGLLVIDYEAGSSSGSGGTSNADKSPIKRDALLFYTLEKRIFNDPEDAEELKLSFTVITEYVDPNYENVYPEEYTVPAGEITLPVSFGETYAITISGGRENGYTAVLAE